MWETGLIHVGDMTNIYMLRGDVYSWNNSFIFATEVNAIIYYETSLNLTWHDSKESYSYVRRGGGRRGRVDGAVNMHRDSLYVQHDWSKGLPELFAAGLASFRLGRSQSGEWEDELKFELGEVEEVLSLQSSAAHVVGGGYILMPKLDRLTTQAHEVACCFSHTNVFWAEGSFKRRGRWFAPKTWWAWMNGNWYWFAVYNVRVFWISQSHTMVVVLVGRFVLSQCLG